MNVRRSRVLFAVAAFFGLAVAFAPAARAVPVSVDITALRAAQLMAPKASGEDQAYLLITGVAKGKALEAAKLPKDETYTVSKKKPGIDPAKPVTIWSGDLADGEFAELTVTLFQGKADEAKLKEFTGKLADADKKAPALMAAKIASPADQAKLATDLLAAHRAVITDIKKMFSRAAKTDHYGGQFTIIVWNQGGKITNRVDPVGLTFGEHYGTGEKIYTKIKNTLQNFQVKDETGDYAMKQLGPLDDEEVNLRVKMLETEKTTEKNPETGELKKKVVDYIVEVQVKAEGKPVHWQLGGEKLGISDVHTYWEFAETKKEKVKKPEEKK